MAKLFPGPPKHRNLSPSKKRGILRNIHPWVEVKTVLLATALVHPMVRFSLRNDTEGRRETMLSTPRVDTAALVFCGVLGSKLGDSVR